jgi:hypothetical protein
VAVSILGEAAIRLRPDASGFQAEAEAGIVGPSTGVAKKAAGLFAAAFAAEKVGEFLKESVTQASDLSESTSKVGVVFGDSAQEVLDFAANASTAFGQTRGQALEAAGTFGNLLRSIGLTSDAVRGHEHQDGRARLRPGLVQQHRPRRGPGSAPRRPHRGDGAAEAVRHQPQRRHPQSRRRSASGLDASGPTLSANVKAQAAYSLIMQQSSLAQGDFARTSAGLANQQRIMSSQWKDLQANIGGLFVPALGNAAGLLTGHLMPALLRSTSGLSDLGSTIGAFGDYVRAGFNQDDVVGLYEATGPLAVRMVDLAVNAGVAGGIFTEAFADGKAGADLLASEGLGGLAARAGVAAAPRPAGVRRGVPPPGHRRARPRLPRPRLRIDLGQRQGRGRGRVLRHRRVHLRGVRRRRRRRRRDPVPAVLHVRRRHAGRRPRHPGPHRAHRPGDHADAGLHRGRVRQLGPVIGNVFSQLAPVFAQLGRPSRRSCRCWRSSRPSGGTCSWAFQALLPILPTLLEGLGTIVAALLSGLLPVIQQLAPVIGQVVSAFQGALVGAIQALVPVIPTLVDALVQIAGVLAESLGPILQASCRSSPPSPTWSVRSRRCSPGRWRPPSRPSSPSCRPSSTPSCRWRRC